MCFSPVLALNSLTCCRWWFTYGIRYKNGKWTENEYCRFKYYGSFVAPHLVLTHLSIAVLAIPPHPMPSPSFVFFPRPRGTTFVAFAVGVKVNGKVRAELELSKTATSEDARALAEVLPQVQYTYFILFFCRRSA